MKVRLDAALCDGFGTCGAHAPDVFGLDEWGYAFLASNGEVPDGQEDQTRRAIADCPVHAIIEIG